MAICTNSLLLICLYDQEGKWRIEPGLAAILLIEHVLLFVKFGFSHFVPEVSSIHMTTFFFPKKLAGIGKRIRKTWIQFRA